MRRLFSPLPPLFIILLACAAASAQPHRPPERSARCRAAALKYLGPSPDKKHLTVEQEDAYEYRGMKKYLAVCGNADDDFTRRIKEAVAGYEAARLAPSPTTTPPSPCAERRAELSKRLLGPERYTDERSKQNFEAAKKFLHDCGDEKEKFDRFVSDWVSKYEKAVREFEEKKRQGGEPPAKEPKEQ